MGKSIPLVVGVAATAAALADPAEAGVQLDSPFWAQGPEVEARGVIDWRRRNRGRTRDPSGA